MAARISTAKSVVGQKENVSKNTSRIALKDIGNKAVASIAAKAEIVKKVAKDNLHLDNILKHEVEKKPLPPTNDSGTGLSFSSCLLDVEDIDENDSDPQFVSEFVNNIYDHLRSLELKYLIKRNYLSGKQINGGMRAILVDWLVQVHQHFGLVPETLYLTVAILDRFLQISNIHRKNLQLVGVTAMFIASKYEEIYAPDIKDYTYITDETCDKSEICQMERIILKALDFSLGRPLPLHFLRRNSKAGKVNSRIHTFAKYLTELMLIEYNMVHHSPSITAAAALCLAMKVLENKSWTNTLIHYSKYYEEDLHPIMIQMAKNVLKAKDNKLVATRKKFSSPVYLAISTIPEINCDTMKSLASGNFF